MASNLEKKILNVLQGKKEALKEDVNGVVAGSQFVKPEWVDLGASPTSPTDGLPDYTKGIAPGQAALPGMNPTPGVGTVEGDATPFTPNKAVNEEEDREDEDDEEGDNPKENKPEVNEDLTADEENGRQKAKYASAEKQQKVKGQAGDDDDDDKKDVNECACGKNLKEGEEVCESCKCDKKDMKEDVEALFAGEKLTPAFKKKAATIFEAAVTARVNAILEREAARLVEEYEQAVAQVQEELATKVDGYLNYVVEQWVTENAIAIETGLKSELVEDFLLGLKQLFAENYIEVPSEKVDVLEALAEKVEELEESLNSQIESNVTLKEANAQLERQVILSESVKGLTEVQAQKLLQLVEGVDFKDKESFTDSVKVLKESQIVTKPKKSQNLTEEAESKPFEVEPKGEMKTIIDALKRTSR